MTKPNARPGVYRADLHMHSVFSDGLKTPETLCAMAHELGLQAVALTDHDTVGGVEEMGRAAQAHGLDWLPGVEIGSGASGRTHIVCYGSAVEGTEMRAFLQRMSDTRKARAEEMVRLLETKAGIHLTEEGLKLLDRPNVSRPHVARAMVASGVVDTTDEAFDRYLAEGKCAYVPRTLLSAQETVVLARRLGAVPVLAHPMRLKMEETAITAFILSLKEAGLMGVEAFHPSASPRMAGQLEALARREGLLVTGGSDYHGDPQAHARIGGLAEGWTAIREDVQALMNAVNHPR